jgi:hypothetical protein
MSDVRFLPIDPDRLAAMRAAGADEFGNPWTPFPAEGWEPLRCCLRGSDTGESIALITYSPWAMPSPWMEAGPVFVHAAGCAGYGTTGAYPPALLGSRRWLNPFDHGGARVYDHITFLEADDDHEAAVRDLLARPEVAFVHVRSALAGCLMFEARPAGAP